MIIISADIAICEEAVELTMMSVRCTDSVSRNNNNNKKKSSWRVLRGDVSMVLHLESTVLYSAPAPRWSWSECKCRRRCRPGRRLQHSEGVGGIFTRGMFNIYVRSGCNKNLRAAKCKLFLKCEKHSKKIETQEGWFEKDQNDATEPETSSFFY